MNRFAIRVPARLVAAAVVILLTTSRAQAERLCGWLNNPTPNNFWLTDRYTDWQLSMQGAQAVPGFDTMPDMTRRGWIETNAGGHGHGCACLTALVDYRTRRIIRLIRADAVPLAQCQRDPQLPRPLYQTSVLP